MNKETLIFPDLTILSNFLIDNDISGAIVNSLEISITATFTEEQIMTAYEEYKAVLSSRQKEAELIFS